MKTINNMPKSVLYCRVSSKDQEETGYSLPAQEKLLKDYSQNKFRINKIFSISESASGKKIRDTFQEMLKYLKQNQISVIVCEKIDRLTRNLKDAAIINDWVQSNPKHEVHFVKESFVLNKNTKAHENLVWDMKVAIARFYTNNLSEEVQKGFKEKISQGWLPNKAPMGYKTIGEKGHKIQVIDENIAPLIKQLFELYATGNYSLKKLSQIMFKQGLRTIKGKRMAKSTLHNILTRPFYSGKILWKNEIYPGKHEPIVTEEVFEKVQLNLTSKTTPKYNKHHYVFQKLMTCKECNGTITWEIQKGIVYGHCNHKNNCQQKTWAKQAEIEEQVSDITDRFKITSPKIDEWIRMSLKEDHKEEIVTREASAKQLHIQYSKLSQRLDTLYIDKLDGLISDNTYKELNQKFTKEKEDISRAIDRLTRKENAYYELGISIYELTQQANIIFENGLPDNKRELLKVLFDEMKIENGILSVKLSKPFEMLAKLTNILRNSNIEILSENTKNKFEQVTSSTNMVNSHSHKMLRSGKLPLIDMFRTKYYSKIISLHETLSNFTNQNNIHPELTMV